MEQWITKFKTCKGPGSSGVESSPSTHEALSLITGQKTNVKTHVLQHFTIKKNQ